MNAHELEELLGLMEQYFQKHCRPNRATTTRSEFELFHFVVFWFVSFDLNCVLFRAGGILNRIERIDFFLSELSVLFLQ